MYITDLNLSRKITNILVSSQIITLDKLLSLIENDRFATIKGVNNDDISEIINNVYCRNCKRSIYGEYKDCDTNIENDGLYTRGVNKCGCKISFKTD